MDYFIPGMAGLAVGAALGWLLATSRLAAMREQVRQAQELRAELADLRSQKEQLQVALARLEKEKESDAQRLQWLTSAETAMREAFQSLAAQSLQTNADQFIVRAREQLNTIAQKLNGDWGTQKQEMKNIVQPLQESLRGLDAHVQELEQKREGAYAGLKENITQLLQAHATLQQTTHTLTSALRSNTVRGRWGEIQLRRIVEMAGMAEHVDFDEQTTTAEGRPDMLIRLPNAAVLAVDSKTPMTSYLEALDCTEDERPGKLLRHARAMRERIKELAGKAYWSSSDHCAEFVVMFIPNDACLGAAYQTDGELLQYAISQKVLPTTPVTLLALLKAVAFGWQQQNLALNAQAIAAEGRELHTRMGTFLKHMQDMGGTLRRTVEQYNGAVGSLESRLMPSVRRFQELGVGTQQLRSPEQIDMQPRYLASTDSGETGNGNGNADTNACADGAADIP